MLVAESLANRFLDITFLVVQSLTTFPHLSPAAATSFSPPGCKATEKILSGTTWDLGWVLAQEILHLQITLATLSELMERLERSPLPEEEVVRTGSVARDARKVEELDAPHSCRERGCSGISQPSLSPFAICRPRLEGDLVEALGVSFGRLFGLWIFLGLTSTESTPGLYLYRIMLTIV